MHKNWIVIGITGVTCGGKTTLSKELAALCQTNHVKIISQDDYFLHDEDPRHLFVSELNHNHFDIITSLDMDKLYQDVLEIISAPVKPSGLIDEDGGNLGMLLSSKEKHLLIIEGFNILEDERLERICDLKYFFTLDEVECRRRRMLRSYDPPDCEGYFDVCVWPEYLKYRKFAEMLDKVVFFESNSNQYRSRQVVQDLIKLLN